MFDIFLFECSENINAKMKGKISLFKISYYIHKKKFILREAI